MKTTDQLVSVFKITAVKIRFCIFSLLLGIAHSPNLSAATVSHKKVIIPLNNWSSQRVISKAIGNILEKSNYLVTYKNISSKSQWGALARGLVHFQLEVWEPSMAQESRPFINNKNIIDVGTHSAKAREDWWYPNYVAKFCPQLPDWRALNECSHLFAGNGSKKGIYYTGPWSFKDPDLIRSLKLNFSITRLTDDQAIWRQLRRATQANKPIVMLNWSPNWTDVRAPGQFINFPAYHPACETVASWGINSDKTFDCGNKKDAWIKKVVWPKLKEKLPCVYEFIKQVDLSNEMIAEASALVDFDGLSEDQAIDAWLLKYAAQIENWSKNSCISSERA